MRLRAFVAPIIALSLALTPATPALAAPSTANIDTLVRVFTMLEESHFTHPDEEALLRGAISGMLQALGDPYSSYMSPAEFQEFIGAINQAYAGIGTALQSYPNGTLFITTVYPGSPAEEAGLQAGDQILAVNFIPVTADNVGSMPEKIRGAEGTQLTLQVRRAGAAPALYLLTRAAIELPTVVTEDLGDGLAYIQILSFGKSTAAEVTRAVNAATQQGARALVLDVRGNGGGYVVSALEIADLFLSQGMLIAVHDEHGQEMPVNAEPPVATHMPVAVLVDGNSASASEILAGALQKSGRATLVGSPTFGKGTMQATEELPNGGFLKLSVDRWEYADGTHSDRVPLQPDLPISTPSLVLPATVQRLGSAPRPLTFSRTGSGVTFGTTALQGAPMVAERNGRVFLPLRYTLEALGYEVQWTPDTAEARIVLGTATVQADLKGGTIFRSGVRFGQPGDVATVEGQAYIAADALGALLGRPVTVTNAAVIVQ
jgi:carboxyl-terminal processing protease